MHFLDQAKIFVRSGAGGPGAVSFRREKYVNQSLIQDQGKIGRSQGCFAFAKEDISAVLARVPAGCLLYADKV